MKKVWVVVANGSHGKIYRVDESNALIEVIDAHHLESHLKTHEIVSDRPGYATSQNFPGRRAFASKTPPKLKEKEFFAEELALALNKSFNQKDFEFLYLIANDPFISMLHHHLNADVSKCIVSEIHKDLTAKTPQEIRSYLPLCL